MFELTDAAREYLSKLLDQAEAPEGFAARVIHEEEGLTLSIDQPQAGDERFEHDGRTVLVLDPQVAETLDGQMLDVEQAEEGPRLTVQENG